MEQQTQARMQNKTAATNETTAMHTSTGAAENAQKQEAQDVGTRRCTDASTSRRETPPARKQKHPAAKNFPRPNPWIYYPASVIVRLFLRFKLKTRYDIKALKGIRGPAFIVCPHVSNIDFLLVAVALLPHRPTFVVSQHFMTHPKIRWILEKMHVIPKKMFCPDIKTILSIMRAKESGNLIVLFPEGRLTCFGHSLQVTDGTADLVKKLAVPVYMISEDGAYKSFPKWGKAGFRPGRILVRAEKLLEADAIPAMSLNEVQAVLERAVLHDEDKLFPDVRYRCKSPALGLDGILYKCPSCLAEFRMETDARHIRCTACGFEAELDETYRLHGAPFTHINDWYFWQESLLDLAIPLESETVLAAVGPDGNMDKNAGAGRIYMDRDAIRYTGTCFGKPLAFTEKTEDIKAFPASVAAHFDIYHKKQLYNMHLRPDPRAVIKWVSYLDKLTRERETAAKNAEADNQNG